jgi:hypothetical protein
VLDLATEAIRIAEGLLDAALFAGRQIGDMGLPRDAAGHRWTGMGLAPRPIEREGVIQQSCRSVAEDRLRIANRAPQMFQH